MQSLKVLHNPKDTKQRHLKLVYGSTDIAMLNFLSPDGCTKGD